MPSPPSTLVASARREALLCGVIFVCAITYTISTCVRMGYRDPSAPLEFVMGFPDWIFYGVICPWAVCTAIAGLFSFVIMKDHELGEAADVPLPTEDAILPVSDEASKEAAR